MIITKNNIAIRFDAEGLNENFAFGRNWIDATLNTSNATLTESLPPSQIPFKWKLENGEWVLNPDYVEPPAPPTPVPQSVTMRQARLALHKQGLLSQMGAALAELPEPQQIEAKIEWEYAATVERTSSLVTALTTALNMSETETDDLFVLASTF